MIKKRKTKKSGKNEESFQQQIEKRKIKVEVIRAKLKPPQRRKTNQTRLTVSLVPSFLVS